MGFQNSKGTLSKLQNNIQNLKDARKVADIFSRETFQIFNILLKKKKSASTISLCLLLFTFSRLGHTEVPLTVTHLWVLLPGSDTTTIQPRVAETALTSLQMFLHLLSITTSCLCPLFPFTLKGSLLWFH